MPPRNTKQRQHVIRVLQEAERPLTVTEILERGQRALATLGIATIYREIGRLGETGEVASVLIPGDPVRYEMKKHHHHHFKCMRCDKVFELEGCNGAATESIPKGFTVLAHELTFFGICKPCAP